MTDKDLPEAVDIRGWVYVLSHPHMTALKIGFTLRAVEERLAELSNTSVPGTFVWEFGILVDNPSSVERKCHQSLREARLSHQREFFSCSLTVAVVALTAATSRTTVYAKHDRRMAAGQAAKILEQRQHLDAWLLSKQQELSLKHTSLMHWADSLCPSLWGYWIGYSLLAVLLLEGAFNAKNSVGVFIGSAILGLIAASFNQNSTHTRRKQEAGFAAHIKRITDQKSALAEHASQQRQYIDAGRSFVPAEESSYAQPSTSPAASPEQRHVTPPTTQAPERIPAPGSLVAPDRPVTPVPAPSLLRATNRSSERFCGYCRTLVIPKRRPFRAALCPNCDCRM